MNSKIGIILVRNVLVYGSLMFVGLLYNFFFGSNLEKGNIILLCVLLIIALLSSKMINRFFKSFSVEKRRSRNLEVYLIFMLSFLYSSVSPVRFPSSLTGLIIFLTIVLIVSIFGDIYAQKKTSRPF
ncbi:hypothetical protein [Pisciglobus halotolerans]|uniref:Uncharacterized protein n=1 Tax=Pisciglobus halotolerans TaxID=745365 RepID=A0A1I3DYH9_9LACT|nr:hypothetical protein [Pisciglobus halotolerans]SFH91638.1 hypothetical protein SAMN04489868_1586 [Pisciglobus halotolerans]